MGDETDMRWRRAARRRERAPFKAPGLVALVGSLMMVALGCSGGPFSEPPPAARPNVLLIVVDTLRKGDLGAYGYARETSPNLDRLAAASVRYGWAFSQAAWTTPSVSSLMSSRFPSQIGIEGELTRLPDDLLLLPEVLGSHGYATGGIVSNAFCSGKWNFDQGFDFWDESSVGGHKAITSPGVTAKALEYLEGSDGTPFFLWLHYFDPHVGYIGHEEHPFGSREGYDGPAVSGVEVKELRVLKRAGQLEDEDVVQAKNLYDSEVAFTDHHLGLVLDRLVELDLFDDTLIVFTADHGEGFGEHGQLGHATSLYNEVVNVPLLVKYPEATAGATPGDVIDEPVALIDLFPTILEVTGVSSRPPVEGRVMPPLGSGAPRPVFVENARAFKGRAVVVGDLKLIQNLTHERFELYDLATDAAERVDLLQGENAEGFAELRRVLEAWAERMRSESGVGGGEVSLTPAEEARLRSLGYLDP